MNQITINGTTFLAPNGLSQAIETINEAPKGSFATIHAYESKGSGSVDNINFQSRFSYLNYNEKKANALKELTLDQVEIKDEKLLALSQDKLEDQFKTCVDKMLASIEKTKEGDRSDSHREAHDKFYLNVGTGVKIKFRTMEVGGETHLVKQNGLPIANNLQLAFMERSKKNLVPGTYKKVNSGPKVLMDKAIAKALKKHYKVGTYKTLSLDNNFKTLKIGGEELN